MPNTGTPFLSVVIPAYNAQKYLRETVSSLLCQPCKDLQVIIVNDGSKDNTLAIARELAASDSRIHVVDRENGGEGAARNSGLDLCEKLGTHYVTFLDSDDVWTDHFYDSKLHAHMQHTDKDLFYFGHYYANSDLSRGRRVSVLPTNDSEDSLQKYGIHCCYIYKFSLIAQHKLRFATKYRTQADTTFTFAFCSAVSTFEHINKEIFLYRSNASSVSHSKFDPVDRYFQHAIPAWQWAEKEVVRICHKAGNDTTRPVGECQTMQKTYLPEFITVACQCGVCPSKIRAAIDDSGMKNLFSEGNTVWVDAQSQQAWNRFYAHPWRFWIKQRAKGIAISLGQRVKHFSIVENKRYPVALDAIYTHKG